MMHPYSSRWGMCKLVEGALSFLPSFPAGPAPNIRPPGRGAIVARSREGAAGPAPARSGPGPDRPTYTAQSTAQHSTGRPAGRPPAGPPAPPKGGPVAAGVPNVTWRGASQHGMAWHGMAVREPRP
eukprot:scaffold1973_cov399-Prasinococcus_capsulatus_cf.AAC.16